MPYLPYFHSFAQTAGTPTRTGVRATFSSAATFVMLSTQISLPGNAKHPKIFT